MAAITTQILLEVVYYFTYLAINFYLGELSMEDKAGIKMAEGRSISCERIQGVNDNMSQSHYHGHFELYFLEAGERYHMLNDDIYETKASDFMLFAPYVMHHSYSNKDVEFKRIVLYFTEDSIMSKDLLEKLKKSSGLYHPNSRIAGIIKNYLNELLQEEAADNPYKDEAMTALLNSLLIAIIRTLEVEKRPEMKNKISKVIEYIEENYAKEIKLNDLSSRFYTSEYHLCREFKKYTNKTIVQYINAIRIMHAQILIMETNKSFTEIAGLTGFSSLTHFNRTFNSILKMSPSAFKNNCKAHQ